MEVDTTLNRQILIRHHALGCQWSVSNAAKPMLYPRTQPNPPFPPPILAYTSYPSGGGGGVSISQEVGVGRDWVVAGQL